MNIYRFSFFNISYYRVRGISIFFALLLSLFFSFAVLAAPLPSAVPPVSESVEEQSVNNLLVTTLRRGSRGDDVKKLQGVLGVVSDGVFGPKTEAAVKGFQGAVGLVADGIVGKNTRAKLNAQFVQGVAAYSGSFSPVPGLTVSLASDTPLRGYIISDGVTNIAGSQALVDFLHLRFETPQGTTAKIFSLTLKRTGNSADENIARTYLYEEGGKIRIAKTETISSGLITFSRIDAKELFTVKNSKTIWVLVDIHKDTLPNQTIGFNIVAQASIVTDVTAINGKFPLISSLMTTVSVSDFGRLQMYGQPNAITTEAGGTGIEAFKFQFIASNQTIKILSLTFTNIGSTGVEDIANLRLYDNAIQIGSEIASMTSEKIVTFDLRGSPLVIPSNSMKTLTLEADVLGGTKKTIQFAIAEGADVVALDVNYNAIIQPDNGTVGVFSGIKGTSLNIDAGSLVVALSNNSPTGNIVLRAADAELASYELKAIGEDIKVSSLQIVIDLDDANDTGATAIGNIKVLLDDNQIELGTASVALGDGSRDADQLYGEAFVTNVDGVSDTESVLTVPTNFIISAGQKKVMTIKGSIVSTANATQFLSDGDTITVVLLKNSLSAERLVSKTVLLSPAIDILANTLTIGVPASTASAPLQ